MVDGQYGEFKLVDPDEVARRWGYVCYYVVMGVDCNDFFILQGAQGQAEHELRQAFQGSQVLNF